MYVTVIPIDQKGTGTPTSEYYDAGKARKEYNKAIRLAIQEKRSAMITLSGARITA